MPKSQAPDPDELLTTGQAAVVAGVSVSRIQQFLRAGRLPFVRVGHYKLIKRSDAGSIERRRPGRPKRKRP
jgi:excisionase family DNA binding protein